MGNHVASAVKHSREDRDDRLSEDLSARQSEVQVDIRPKNKMAVPQDAGLAQEDQLLGRVNSIGAVWRSLARQPVHISFGNDASRRLLPSQSGIIAPAVQDPVRIVRPAVEGKHLGVHHLCGRQAHSAETGRLARGLDVPETRRDVRAGAYEAADRVLPADRAGAVARGDAATIIAREAADIVNGADRAGAVACDEVAVAVAHEATDNKNSSDCAGAVACNDPSPPRPRIVAVGTHETADILDTAN